MDYHYNKKRRKKKYRIKKLPIFILIIILAALITTIVFAIKGILNKNSSSSASSSLPINTSSIQSSDTSSDTLSDNLSSNNISSEDASTGITVEQVPPSSKDNIEPAVSSTVSSSSSSSSSTIDNSNIEQMLTGAYTIPVWNLVLLNRDNAISNEIQFEKTKFDSQSVDARAGEWYKKMYDAAIADGITLYLRSGYRSMKTQDANYNAAIKRHMDNGKTKEEAIIATDQYYTKPGHSEHHSGLAFDIITPEYHNEIYSLDDRFAQTDAYTWLINNAADYGFILRYPQDKVNITKINFEAWHYRYVGVNHAKAMKKNNMCLEEYIDSIKNSFLDSHSATDEASFKNELISFADEYAQMLIG